MMLSATKAKEIMDKAVEARNAEIRHRIECEVERVCEEIRDAATRRHSSYRISPGMLEYPKRVMKYLKDELGYECDSYTDGAIVVRWAPAA